MFSPKSADECGELCALDFDCINIEVRRLWTGLFLRLHCSWHLCLWPKAPPLPGISTGSRWLMDLRILFYQSYWISWSIKLMIVWVFVCSGGWHLIHLFATSTHRQLILIKSNKATERLSTSSSSCTRRVDKSIMLVILPPRVVASPQSANHLHYNYYDLIPAISCVNWLICNSSTASVFF